MEVVGVVLDARRLVGAAEAEVVGGDDARDPCERRDQLSVQERPGRLAVQEEYRVACTLVDVVHSQPVLLQVARREVVAREGRRSARRGCGMTPPTDHYATKEAERGEHAEHLERRVAARPPTVGHAAVAGFRRLIELGAVSPVGGATSAPRSGLLLDVHPAVHLRECEVRRDIAQHEVAPGFLERVSLWNPRP